MRGCACRWLERTHVGGLQGTMVKDGIHVTVTLRDMPSRGHAALDAKTRRGLI